MRTDNYFNEIEKLINENNLSIENVLKNYLVFTRRRDLPRFLAHYEIFKLIKDIPGSIVEVGVYMGSGMFTWANLLETFCPGDRNRLVFGFDDFEGYNKFTDEDSNFKRFIESHDHFLKSDYDFMKKLLDIKTNDNLLPGIRRAEIINGDVSKTIYEFKNNNAGLRLSLLYLDVSLYQPTRTALEGLYEWVVPNGIIALNGYGQHPHEGEGKALDDFILKRKLKPNFERFPFSPTPSVYFKKC